MFKYHATKINITQHPNFKSINFDYPILVLFQDNPSSEVWHQLPKGELLQKRWSKLQKIKQLNATPSELELDIEEELNLETFRSQLPNDVGTEICLINLKSANSAFKKLEFLKKHIISLAQDKPEQINLIVSGFDFPHEENIINDFIVCIGSFYTFLPKISQKHNYNPNSNLTINLHGISKQYDYTRALAEVQGNGLTRFLCNLPANYLYPETYREYVQSIAKDVKWTYEFIDQAQLKQKQAGAYLAVVQGSARKDAGIIKLHYKPQSPTNKKIVLVGKGLCFDTGGHNLKTPLGSMYTMHHDMTGSAVALGTLYALTQLRVPFEVEAWLALAQNDIGPEAYKPGDVVFASNGTSIEVINTDAEGRMVLADTLYLASLSEPNVVIDYATLTGSCVRALDEFYSGIFTNQDEWNIKLAKLGTECGERVWPFPYTEEYDDVLKSDIADIKQCHEGSADQIRAARFLGKFIHKDTPWIHIDLSSHAHKGGLGHIHSETTGFGVRYTLNLLLNSDLIE